MASPQNSDSVNDGKKEDCDSECERDIGRNDTAKMQSSKKNKKELRRMQTRRQQATAFATAIMVIVNAAAFFVPEGVKKHVKLSRRVIIGIVTALVLLGTFIALYWWYGGCERYKILTRDIDGMDLDDCVIDPNSIFTTLRIDTNSRWEIESAFSQASAFWQVQFLGFGSKSADNFQSSLTKLREKVNLFLENAVNLQTFELLQYFLHTRFLTRGDLGIARLMPSFSLTSYVQNFELSQVRFFQANELQNCGLNGDKQNCNFSGNVYNIKFCSNKVSGPFLQYDINRLGSSNSYYTTQRSGTQFLVRLNMLKKQQDSSIVSVFDGDSCNQASLLSTPITTREIPYFRECETCRLMDIDFDFALITALDLCNKNIKVCSSFYGFGGVDFTSSMVYTRIKQIVQSRFRTSQASFYDDRIGKFAFTKFELGNEYSIVPEIIPSCPDCSSQQNSNDLESECTKEFDIVFHYYFIRKLNIGNSATVGSRKSRKLLQNVNAGGSSEASATGAPATAVTAVSATTASPNSQFVPLPNTSGNTWYTQVNNKTFIYTNLARNLEAAQSICRDVGGDMAYFGSLEEEDTIMLRLQSLNVPQPSDFVWTSLAHPNATTETLCSAWNWVLSDSVLPLNYENWRGQCRRPGGHPRTMAQLYGGIETPWKAIPRPSDQPAEWITNANYTLAAFLCTVPDIITAAPSIILESGRIPESGRSSTPQVPLKTDVLNQLGFIGTKSYFYSLQKLSWPAASQRCQSIGGNLLQLDSEATENTVNLLLQTNPLYQYTKSTSNPAYFWIGLQNVIAFDGRSEQQWTSGLKTNYSNLDLNVQFYLPGTNQTSCITSFFSFEEQVPSSFWSSVSCDRLNAFVCEFVVDVKNQLGSLPKSPPVPVPSPPPSSQIILQGTPPPPSPPPTQQVLTDIILDNTDASTEQELQQQEQQQVTVDTTDLQPPPEDTEIVPIEESGYQFRTGNNITMDKLYQFSVLISLSSLDPQLAFNQHQTFMPNLQCNGSSIKFSSGNQTTQIPFTLSSNIYECEVEQCRSTLEKLATSFANTELFYVVVALLMVVIVLACCLDRKNLDEDSGTVMDHFYDIFSAMIDAADP